MTGQELRNSILQMAVSGKLVPQDPNDEPAAVLLERIRAEKEKLIKEGKIKRDKHESVIRRSGNSYYEKIDGVERRIDDEIPFEIPESWAWCRVSSLGAIIRGSGIKRNETVTEGMPCIRYGEIYTSYNLAFDKTVSFIPSSLDAKCKHIHNGDIVMTLTGENKPDIAKAVAYLGDLPVAAGGDLCFWTGHGMNPLYLSYLMASPYVISKKVGLATGDIIVHISGDKLGTILIPAPPLAEQQRIVSKIAELQPFIDEYAAKEQELRNLSDSFPDQLRRSILQMAVQGKLVPQDPNDEPAAVLLERIRAEKEKLIKEGKIKRDRHESVICRRGNSYYERIDSIERRIDDEIPFEIPESWEWCRLNTILLQSSTGPFGSVLHKADYVKDGTPLVNPADISDEGINTFKIKMVSPLMAEQLSAYKLKKDDVIIGRRGEMGRSAVIGASEDGWLCGTGCFFVTPSQAILPDYLVLLLKSPYLREALIANSVGTTMNNLNHQILGNLYISLPPLAEQKRIVSKISELQFLIDEYAAKV